VTELVQPLAAAELPTSVVQPYAPSFTELVYAHFAWWRAIQAGDDAGPAAASYRRARAAFEAHHGRVVHAFWCSHIESAVALSELPRKHWWSRRRLGFHRESDWATKNHPELAAELHRCDELAVRSETVLTGVRQRICLHLVAASAGHLLSLVDRTSGHKDDDATLAAMRRERAALDHATEYYRSAANGQAQIAYFAGMASVAAVIAVVSGFTLVLNNWTTSIAALVAGSIGAVISVIQRINSGDFTLDYDVGRPYAMFLGGLRPLIGGAFALALSFAFTSGITHLPVSSSDPETNKRLAILVVGFLAGFSERWAQDTLASALPAPKQEPPAAKTTTTTEARP
jgi:hypothetical protein